MKIKTDDAQISRWYDSFVGHMVLSLIGELPKEQYEKFFEARTAREDKSLTVTVTIDGFDVDFGHFARRIEEQLDRLILEKAGEILKERVGETLFELTHRIQEDLEELSRGVRQKAAEALGYNPWEFER